VGGPKFLMKANKSTTITSNHLKHSHFRPVTKKTSWKHPRELGLTPSTNTSAPSSAPGSPILGNKEQEFVVKKVEIEIKPTTQKGNNVVKYGYISKLGEVWKTWKSRYFVLFDDGQLEYYANVPKTKSPGDYANMLRAEYKGGLDVALCRFRFARGIKKGDLVLEIELNQRHLILSFETKEDLMSWKRHLELQGCEFYDILVPTNKSVIELKAQKKKLRSSVIKRDYKGRAVELALEEQKEEKQTKENSKSFVKDKVISTATTGLYVNQDDDLGVLPDLDTPDMTEPDEEYDPYRDQGIEKEDEPNEEAPTVAQELNTEPPPPMLEIPE
jgi:hypothetical protein